MKYIICGFVPYSTIANLSLEDILYTDSILSTYHHKGRIVNNDIAIVPSESIEDTIKKDNELVLKVYNLLKGPDQNLIYDSFQFVLGYSCVELARLITYLQINSGKSYVLVGSVKYLDAIKILINNFKISNIAIFDEKKIKFLELLKYIAYHRKVSFYGRFNYLKYLFGLPIKLTRLLHVNNYESGDKLFLGAGGASMKLLFNKKWSDCRYIDLDKYCKFSAFEFILSYPKWFLVARRNFKDSKLSSLYPFFSILYYWIGAPFLSYYCSKLTAKLRRNPDIVVMAQESDLSPHRFLNVYVAKNLGIKTLVTQHGEITEPIIISKFISDCAYLYTFPTYTIYRNANPNSVIELVGGLKPSNFKKTHDEPIIEKSIYIFTTSFSGMSFDHSFSFNFRLINFVIDVIHRHGLNINIVVKLHPSESPDLYKIKYKKILFEKSPLDDIINKVHKAITGPSSVYRSLIDYGVPTLYFDSGLQKRRAFPNGCTDLELIDLLREW